MWNMMCDVMPTISEDSISQRSSQLSGEDANFEQLMVSMLDERDKLVESLRETQERLGDSELRLKEVEKERDSLHRQIAANLPQPNNAPTDAKTFDEVIPTKFREMPVEPSAYTLELAWVQHTYHFLLAPTLSS
ncbi:Uncharacterized protein OBRU01_15671 [Operophtera brumata]|uniref:Liprin-alpha n=1 Tax=Operophtera brumata TaxID=104452 RepID=A0A0L7L5J0_OPEBR|nr:Uncharacterized protein OBRU01_15671 [Operophtera brumata]